MKSVVKEILAVSLENLKNEILRLAIEFEIDFPRKITEKLILAEEIQSYGSVERFFAEAPEELLQTSELVELSKTLEQLKTLCTQKNELHRIAAFMGSVSIPPKDVKIGFMAKSLREVLSKTLFTSPHRIGEIGERFETMLAAYIAEYMEFHTEINNKLSKMSDIRLQIQKKIQLMQKLSSIEQLNEYCSDKSISQFESSLGDFLPCSHNPTVEEVAEHFVCPVCYRSFKDEYLPEIFEENADEYNRSFENCLDILSKLLSARILELEDDALKSLLKSISVADLSALTNIISDELIERIAIILQK